MHHDFGRGVFLPSEATPHWFSLWGEVFFYVIILSLPEHVIDKIVVDVDCRCDANVIQRDAKDGCIIAKTIGKYVCRRKIVEYVRKESKDKETDDKGSGKKLEKLC